MLIVYTGNGKGKTSACVGQAVRALGQNFTVFFAQFMKSGRVAGEQRLLGELLGEAFFCNGKGFYRGREEEFATHRAAVEETLAWVCERLAGLAQSSTSPKPAGRMLILDEALYALGHGLLLEPELRKIVDLCRAEDVHLVLSGRGLPQWLEQEADLISEIKEHKHPLQSGGKALPGIEF